MSEDRHTTAAVIGTGFSGAAHIEALRRIPGVEVVAIAGSSAERAAASARDLGVGRSAGDFRELLEDPSIDVIHNCTPNDLHLEVNLAALAAGKHVLAEKPLGMDSAETARLAAAADTAETVTGVCFNYRHYPLVAETRARIAASGAAPHLIQGTYLQDWLLDAGDWNWRLDPARGGSARALGDIGSHWIDLIQHVTGLRIARVCGATGRLHDVRERPEAQTSTFERSAGESQSVDVQTEDFATVLLQFEGGCSGVLTVSQVSPGMRNRLMFDIDLPDVSYVWNQEEPNRLWIGRRDRPNEELVRDATLLSPGAAALSHYPAGHQEGWPDALKNLIADFYAGVRDRSHPLTVASFGDAHRVTLVVEAILASADTGRWVDL